VPRGSPPRRLNLGAPEPDDEREDCWTWLQLEAMDLKFRQRMQSAIERGEERPGSQPSSVIGNGNDI
jgi:hypothetical protein